MLHAVIMAGGVGTRFWPMSRQNRPKHLLPLVGSLSLLQQTVQRIGSLVPAERTWVITGADHAAEVRGQLPEIPAEFIVAEPCRRDTAPCIGLAATLVANRDPEATLVVMPADHVIDPNEKFCNTIKVADALVRDDRRRLVTLGIKPDRPATGYGYIQRGAKLGGPPGPTAFEVKCFREKPNLEVAEQYVRSGEYYWNSGVFIWSAQTILSELHASRQEIVEALNRIGDAWNGPRRDAVLADQYQTIKGISIDYAVLEHSRNVVVVEAEFRWDDVGSWGAVERLHASDACGNTIRGNHCGLETRDSIVVTEACHVVATIGVENLVIVQCGNATLVADKSKEESVKRLVELMRQQGLDKFL